MDAALFALFALAIDVPLTGVPIHEWIGIAIAAVMIIHLVYHANWIASMGRRVFSRTSFQNRVNYLLTIGLFAAFASIVISGLLISETVLPFIGLQPVASTFWFWLHVSSVGWVIAVTAVHIAMNWQWIVHATERLVFTPLRNLSGRP